MTYNEGQELSNNELGSEKEVKVLGKDELQDGEIWSTNQNRNVIADNWLTTGIEKWKLLFVNEFEQMGKSYPVLRIVFCDPKTNEMTQTEITPIGLLYAINEYNKLSTPVCNKVEPR